MAMDSVLEDAYGEAPAETRGTRGNGKSWRKEERIRISGMSGLSNISLEWVRILGFVKEREGSCMDFAQWN